MASLPKKYIKAAWKTPGANKSNALKRAWAAFRKATGTKKGQSTKAKAKKPTKSKNKGKGGNKRMGNKAIGGYSFKGLAIGMVILMLVKWLVRQFAPIAAPYAQGASLVAGGLAGHLTGLPTKNMLPIGLMDLGSEVAVNALGGGYSLGSQGGYDF